MIKYNDPSVFGTLVKSIAGRDRKRVFIVIGVTDEGIHSRLLAVDGHLRRCDAPKAKNLSHVKPVGRLTDEEISLLRTNMNDSAVREILSKYDSRISLKQKD